MDRIVGFTETQLYSMIFHLFQDLYSEEQKQSKSGKRFITGARKFSHKNHLYNDKT